MTALEEYAVNFINENLRYLPKEKRYQVAIPFNNNLPPLKNNYYTAYKRLCNCLAHLERNPKKKAMYEEAMAKYVDKNHAEVVDPREEVAEGEVYYLPHSGVLKASPDGSVTKLRVVFDGSCPDRNGMSLNDRMLAPPVPDSDLLRILTQLRQKPYCFTTDIESCFLNIILAKEQRNLMRFLWIQPGKKEPITYRFRSLIFGAKSSPALSSSCIFHLLNQVSKEFPSLTRRVMRGIYVDDIALSVDSLEEAKEDVKKYGEDFLSCKLLTPQICCIR